MTAIKYEGLKYIAAITIWCDEDMTHFGFAVEGEAAPKHFSFASAAEAKTAARRLVRRLKEEAIESGVTAIDAAEITSDREEFGYVADVDTTPSEDLITEQATKPCAAFDFSRDTTPRFHPNYWAIGFSRDTAPRFSRVNYWTRYPLHYGNLTALEEQALMTPLEHESAELSKSDDRFRLNYWAIYSTDPNAVAGDYIAKVYEVDDAAFVIVVGKSKKMIGKYETLRDAMLALWSNREELFHERFGYDASASKAPIAASAEDPLGEAIARTKELETPALVAVYLGLSDRHDVYAGHVRGWVMDELECRDPESFDAWLNDDSPRETITDYFGEPQRDTSEVAKAPSPAASLDEAKELCDATSEGSMGYAAWGAKFAEVLSEWVIVHAEKGAFSKPLHSYEPGDFARLYIDWAKSIDVEGEYTNTIAFLDAAFPQKAVLQVQV